MEVDCPELFSLAGNEITYEHIMSGIENRYAEETKPFRICGLSLGAILAIDYTLRHGNNVTSLVLIGGQYKVPSLVMDFQNLLFRCMPNGAFQNTGLSKSSMIKLTHSMRTLDFSEKLGKISCPVTVVCGEKDGANMKAAKKLNALLPQSKLHIIPNSGHEVNKCAPEVIAALLDMQ